MLVRKLFFFLVFVVGLFGFGTNRDIRRVGRCVGVEGFFFGNGFEEIYGWDELEMVKSVFFSWF